MPIGILTYTIALFLFAAILFKITNQPLSNIRYNAIADSTWVQWQYKVAELLAALSMFAISLIGMKFWRHQYILAKVFNIVILILSILLLIGSISIFFTR